MSDPQAPCCALCGREMRHDTAEVCDRCGLVLRRDLDGVTRIAGDITLTVAKLAKVSRHGGREIEREWYRGAGALYPTPLPVDLTAAQRHDAAVGELSSWARLIAEERGLGAPGSSLTDEQGQGHTKTRTHPLAALCGFLGGQTEWLRHQPFALEAWPAIRSACRELNAIIDTAAGHNIAGRCDCGHWLYALEGAETVRCRGCGERYEVASSRDALRDHLEDRLMTGAEIATMAGYLCGVNREKARLMIKVWSKRGKLTKRRRWAVAATAVISAADPLYRFGDALPLLMVAYTRAA